MMRRIRMLASIMLLCCWLPTAASANDISLTNIVRNGLTSEFETLAGDLGEALGPKRVGPAASLGALGFDLSLEVSNTLVKSDSSTWRNAAPDINGTLTSLQLQVRKGLPFSFELGGTVTYMPTGDMWGIGLGLKYALIEGYRYIPDMAVRVSVFTALGNRDLNMLMVGSDLVISKSFGLGGAVVFVPYVGYSLLYVRATTNVVGYFDDGATTPSFNVLPISDIVRHRASLGVEVKVTLVSIGIEALLSGGIQTITTRVGVDF